MILLHVVFLNCSAWKSVIYDREQGKKYDTELSHLHTGAEEMVAVAVRVVDRGQVLAMCCDPLPQSICLFDREHGVDEHGVSLAIDKGRRDRRPQPLLSAWR